MCQWLAHLTYLTGHIDTNNSKDVSCEVAPSTDQYKFFPQKLLQSESR